MEKSDWQFTAALLVSFFVVVATRDRYLVCFSLQEQKIIIKFDVSSPTFSFFFFFFSCQDDIKERESRPKAWASGTSASSDENAWTSWLVPIGLAILASIIYRWVGWGGGSSCVVLHLVLYLRSRSTRYTRPTQSA